MHTLSAMIAGVLVWEFVKAAVYVARYVLQRQRQRARRAPVVVSGWCAVRVHHIQQGGMK